MRAQEGAHLSGRQRLGSSPQEDSALPSEGTTITATTTTKTDTITTSNAASTTVTAGASTALRKLSQVFLHQDESSTTTSGGGSRSASTPSNYISNLVSKSGVLLDALKHQYANYLTGGGGGGEDGGGDVEQAGAGQQEGSSPQSASVTDGPQRNNMQSSVSAEQPRGGENDDDDGDHQRHQPNRPAPSSSSPSLSRPGLITNRQDRPVVGEPASTSSTSKLAASLAAGRGSSGQQDACKPPAWDLIGAKLANDDGSPTKPRTQRSISGLNARPLLSNYCSSSNHSSRSQEAVDEKRNKKAATTHHQQQQQQPPQESKPQQDGSRRNMTNPYGDLTAISDNNHKQQQQLQPRPQQPRTDDVRDRDNQFVAARGAEWPPTATTCVQEATSGLALKAGSGSASGSASAETTPKKPPLPPPPPRKILQAVAARSAPSLERSTTVATSSAGTGVVGPASHGYDAVHQRRRYALQEHSLERDQALSFKVVHAKELKHKRTSSIKSVLRHAHLGPLRPSASKRAASKAAREAAGALAALASHPACELTNAATAAAALAAAANRKSNNSTSGCSSSGSGSKRDKAHLPKSMPYELFEPPVTQRTVERSRRRGAMASQLSAADRCGTGGSTDAAGGDGLGGRRQMSFDTIGMRQLTDEYFQNAGLKQPAGLSMVALGEPTNTKPPSAKPGTIAVPGGSSTVAAVVAATVGNSSNPAAAAASQAQCALEAKLYQATREAAAKFESDQQQQQYCSTSLGSASTPTSQSQTHHQHHLKQLTSNSVGSLESQRDHQQQHLHSHLHQLHEPSPDQQNNHYEVTILPGQFPWQSDVSIQCELLQAPSSVEPYETTGDILNTIARPFRGPPLNNYQHTTSFESSSHHHHHHHHHLSATLKRGLSAISQHHLSPGNSFPGSMALNVVGSLKKSISNTFDVGPKPVAQQQQPVGHQQVGHHYQQHQQAGGLGHALQLRSDDSLPAYASLHNEPEEESAASSSNSDQQQHQQQLPFVAGNHHQAQTLSANDQQQQQQQQLQQSGLIGQLASKLSRQSSKKFTEGKRGLQRALSFDCRGYKRLEGGSRAGHAGGGPAAGSQRQHGAGAGVAQTSADSTCSSLGSNGGGSGAPAASSLVVAPNGQQLLAARQRVHNKSSLALQSPRPYLPQSASQVDFQVPLLPYERMQEAIVSQRLLEPLPQSSGSGSNDQQQQQQQRSQEPQRRPDADELICGNRLYSSEQEHLERIARSIEQQQPEGRRTFAGRRRDQSETTTLASADDDDDYEGDGDASGRGPPPQPKAKWRDSTEGPAPASGDELLAANGEQQGRLAMGSSGDVGGELKGSSGSLQRASARRGRGSPPRLVLNIPTIATSSINPADEFQIDSQAQLTHAGIEPGPDGLASTGNNNNGGGGGARQATTVITCLPSPGVGQLEPIAAFDGAGGQLSQSPSFCLDAAGGSGGQRGAESNLLTASDVFKRSKNFIKRPSTMMASDEAEDAMNQVAAALGQATSMKQQQAESSSNGSIRRNRRQAIVPPKLATDACTSSDSETRQPQVGRLVDLGDDQLSGGGTGKDAPRLRQPASRERRHRYCRESSSMDEFCAEEEAQLSTIRRKRSGGGIEKLAAMSGQAAQRTAAPAGSGGGQANNEGTNNSRRALNLPTFQIESSLSTSQVAANETAGLINTMGAPTASERPDSQATNAESIVSSESTASVCMGGRLSPFGGNSSSGAVSPNGTCGANSGGGNGSLSVPFATGSSSRRRSSIAVIPQMQICPGDLLVYSKQLIDRMNQTDENEPPQFLTIDDKKGKNIWSSFKLCAQFDSRTLRARNELLCSLEDVLASLQPSTFVDEQLSHYKGMLWSEFLCETESRRSASSEAQSGNEDNANDNERPPTNKKSYKDELIDVIQVRVEGPSPVNCSSEMDSAQKQSAAQSCSSTGSGNKPPLPPSGQQQATHETHRRTGSMRGDELLAGKSNQAGQEGLKSATGGGGAASSQSSSPSKNTSGSQQQQHPNGQPPAQRTLSSRFREKPKLKRGQTVDSVFRIPLIPSSPLKHAQQHQQTPTAHLEDHDLNIIEDDERSSMGSANSGGGGGGNGTIAAIDEQQHRGSFARRKRSSSTRSRSSGRPDGQREEPFHEHQSSGGGGGPAIGNKSLGNCGSQQCASQDSSFDTEDARDLLEGPTGRTSRRSPTAGSGAAGTTPNQLVRQTSLSTLSSTITRTEQKRQRALWDLFQSECAFFFDHLLTLKNVYMEPLKKIQVEGFAMFADPDVLFGNLDELCCGVYDFCKEFLYIIMRTLKTRPEELNATDVLIKLYKKNPKIDHLRAVYHRYTLNYINALTYLDSLRRQVEFVEFEKWSSRDVRCKKLQLTDLLVAPVQHIMRVPIILKDIEAHTENVKDRDEIRAILAVEEASLRELDDKMRWLKNFERLLEIQKNIQWPSVFDMEPKLYVPDFLKEVLSKQPCEKLIVSPKRQIVHEGTLSNLDLSGKASDMHVILFDDMLLMTRRKKGLTKKASTVCKTNSSGGQHSSGGSHSASSMLTDDGSFKYIVYKQPLSLDRFYVHDVQQVDSQSIGIKHLFLLIVMNRFQQIINVHSFAAPNDDMKQTWLFKIKKTAERWKRINSSSSSNQQQQHQSRSVQQEAPAQQQQSISTSRSMPVSSNSAQAIASSATKPPVQTQQPTGRIDLQSQTPNQQAPLTLQPAKQQQQPDSSGTHHQPHQHNHQHQSGSACGQGHRVAMGVHQAQPVQPIEFVITSASESPASEQQRCR